jgi:hypothetical protein
MRVSILTEPGDQRFNLTGCEQRVLMHELPPNVFPALTTTLHRG